MDRAAFEAARTWLDRAPMEPLPLSPILDLTKGAGRLKFFTRTGDRPGRQCASVSTGARCFCVWRSEELHCARPALPALSMRGTTARRDEPYRRFARQAGISWRSHLPFGAGRRGALSLPAGGLAVKSPAAAQGSPLRTAVEVSGVSLQQPRQLKARCPKAREWSG